ncbi:MAG: nascent polypeptide-associated complex protein [archaeon]
MQAVMKQMGISQEEINAARVIIEKADGGKMVFDNPSVTKTNMQGQDMFQIVGQFEEQSEEPSISEEDIKTVEEKTGATHEQAKKVLENCKGDLAEAILELSG